jgi:hypothetical protein
MLTGRTPSYLPVKDYDMFTFPFSSADCRMTQHETHVYKPSFKACNYLHPESFSLSVVCCV